MSFTIQALWEIWSQSVTILMCGMSIPFTLPSDCGEVGKW